MSLVASMLLAGCQSTENIIGSCVETEGPKLGPGGALPEMRLQAGDKIKVTVFGEDQLSGVYSIDPSGSLSLPLVGTMRASGLTRPSLERILEKKLESQQFLIQPKVTVEIASFRPFYVLGEVEKPGEYPYQSSLNVESAVAVAGGHTYRASNSHILVQRVGEDGYRECPMSTKVIVYPGDIVRVPERYF